MKKWFFCLMLWGAGGIFFCFAQDNGVSVSMRYYQKKVYYDQDDQILVSITVANNSPRIFRFRIADDRAFSLDFDMWTLSNRPVEHAGMLQRKRDSSGHVFFRDVSIEAGEAFSFTENLRDYINIAAPGSYVFQAKVYPELLTMANRQVRYLQTEPEAPAAPLVSNRLSLQIKPQSILGQDMLPVALDVETNAILAREKIAPDQVVTWTLQARQKSQWEKFFLYLDLEKMITRDGARGRRWRAESEEGRIRMLANYRRDLQRATIDGDIAAIPFQFEIEQTSYNANTGTVIVLEKFKAGDYAERKRYTYYLEKENDFWTIVDYVVMNLGTE